MRERSEEEGKREKGCWGDKTGVGETNRKEECLWGGGGGKDEGRKDLGGKIYKKNTYEEERGEMKRL